MPAALCVKAVTEILVRLFQAILDVWERSEVKVLLRADQEVTVTLKVVQGEAQAGHLAGVFASGQSRLHGCHGSGKFELGRTAAHYEACHRDVGRRQTRYRSRTCRVDGATLLFAPLQVACATRRWDASRSVANQQLQRRVCFIR